MNRIYDNERLQERQSASPALSSSGIVNSDVYTKPDCHMRGENTGNNIRSNVGKQHTVFVLNTNGEALTPTTPTKARKLLEGNKATKLWSKFNIFGIQLLEKTREEIPKTSVGYDPGTKFEGISVVCGNENNLSIKLDLPNKKNVVRKLTERRILRRNRHYRKCRRRKIRFKNRSREGFIAPSQIVIINSRLKILKEICKIYPIQNIAMEDVRFNHTKYSWGKNFSTIEIGKNKIRDFFKSKNIKIFEYRGFETSKIRKKYEYRKTFVKNVDKFSVHCSDSLALAVDVNCKKRIPEGIFLVVDDTYRCIRRKLHNTRPSKKGIRKKYSQGSISNIGKGIIIGSKNGNIGQLCGSDRGNFRYYDLMGKRKTTRKLSWINNQFKIKEKMGLYNKSS